MLLFSGKIKQVVLLFEWLQIKLLKDFLHFISFAGCCVKTLTTNSLVNEFINFEFIVFKGNIMCQ